MRFQPVSKATATKGAPNLVQAEIARARMENDAQMAQNRQRSQNIMGAGALYNAGMGDKTPIADYLSTALRGGAGAEEAGGGFESAIDPNQFSAVPEQAEALAGETLGGIDPEAFSLAGESAGGAIPEAMSLLGDTGAEDLVAGMGEAGVEAGAEAAGGVTDAIGGVPALSMLKGGSQLAEGDVAGAAGTASKAYLASLGPYGMAAAAILGLLGS